MSLENRVTSLLHKVPGYTGYRDKEDRRDEDKRLRDAIASEIQQSVDGLTKYNADLSAARELKSLARTETLVGQLRLLADRIHTASYGYGGIFTERSVDGAALDQLRQFDITLQGQVGSLATLVSALSGSTPPKDNDVRALSAEIDRLNLLFSARTDVIDYAKPSRDQQVLDLLDTSQPAAPTPLLSVKRGDTLSVLGDNFVANATITVTTADGPLNLIRVSEEELGATWLLGSGIESMPSARLTESTAGTPDAGTLQRGTAVIDTGKGRQEDVAVQYSSQHDGDGISLTLVIGDTSHIYRGNEIRDIDVEVYGAA
ncbi:MAG TPA: hypothetical protein VNZ58_07405 [Thermomicrobiales bacterium]|nr:hypothetical protein [Thermomicrobiales bacterium]